jgi:hypothetical protein
VSKENSRQGEEGHDADRCTKAPRTVLAEYRRAAKGGRGGVDKQAIHRDGITIKASGADKNKGSSLVPGVLLEKIGNNTEGELTKRDAMPVNVQQVKRMMWEAPG